MTGMIAQARLDLLRTSRESDLQKLVTDAADVGKWLWYHPNQPTHDRAGFLDLTLIRPPHLLFVEMKAANGRLRADQKNWLRRYWALEQAEGVEAVICWPCDVDAVADFLRGTPLYPSKLSDWMPSGGRSLREPIRRGKLYIREMMNR